MKTPAQCVVMAPVSPAMAKLLHQLQAQIIKERDQAAEDARPAGTIVLAPVEAGTWKTVEFGCTNGDQAMRVRSDTGAVTMYRDHLPDGDGRVWHPARWWGSEQRDDAQGRRWSYSLPRMVMDDFGTLVPVVS